jgi:hypothetical protein
LAVAGSFFSESGRPPSSQIAATSDRDAAFIARQKNIIQRRHRFSPSNQPWREERVNRGATKFNPIYWIGILMQKPISVLNRGIGLIWSRPICVDATRQK